MPSSSSISEGVALVNLLRGGSDALERGGFLSEVIAAAKRLQRAKAELKAADEREAG